MVRNINLVGTRDPQNLKPEKPRFLRSKDLLKAFSRENVIAGQAPNGVWVFIATLDKSHKDITIILLVHDGDPSKIKKVIDETFSSTEVVEPAPGDLDLRKFVAEGQIGGNWRLESEESGLSFCVLCTTGYHPKFHSDRDAWKTLTKILEIGRRGISGGGS